MRSRSMLNLLFIVLLPVAVIACAGPQPAVPPTVSSTSSEAEISEETGSQEPAAVEPQVTIIGKGSAQFEIINSSGTRVLVDVASPNTLSRPATAADVLLTTHGHSDHVNSKFLQSFPGQQLNVEEGQIILADVSIKGVKSAHNAFNELDGSNYIYIIDMAGLRIAHFGDIGQDELTPEQLETLGDVDIAITQFKNSYSQMDTVNKKGFNLMAQLQPRLIIPHHGNESKEVIEMALEEFAKVLVSTEPVTVNRSNLPEQTTVLVMQDQSLVTAYKKLFNLSDW